MKESLVPSVNFSGFSWNIFTVDNFLRVSEKIFFFKDEYKREKFIIKILTIYDIDRYIVYIQRNLVNFSESRNI